MKVFQKIAQEVESWSTDAVPKERKIVLDEMTAFIKKQLKSGTPLNLQFVCTHNSRRSQFSQIWAQTLAAYFGMPMVTAYSAGTEATALHNNVVDALQTLGFEYQVLEQSNNPIYAIKYAPNTHPVIGFSKTLDHGFNPQTDFIAVMTCTHADETCPFVPGAIQRFSLPFEDPKSSDGQPNEQEVYLDTGREIGKALYYLFLQLN